MEQSFDSETRLWNLIEKNQDNQRPKDINKEGIDRSYEVVPDVFDEIVICYLMVFKELDQVSFIMHVPMLLYNPNQLGNA